MTYCSQLKACDQLRVENEQLHMTNEELNAKLHQATDDLGSLQASINDLESSLASLQRENGKLPEGLSSARSLPGQHPVLEEIHHQLFAWGSKPPL